jgi:2-hydroxy-3-keto-5-methylthiopentenyl-1-phosphate phosphatase
VKELIAHLQDHGIPVFLVTGGFREIVEQKIATKLAIPSSRIFSNLLHFDSDGKYLNFDRSQLTSKSGTKMVGKAGVCAFLKKK